MPRNAGCDEAVEQFNKCCQSCSAEVEMGCCLLGWVLSIYRFRGRGMKYCCAPAWTVENEDNRQRMDY